MTNPNAVEATIHWREDGGDVPGNAVNKLQQLGHAFERLERIEPTLAVRSFRFALDELAVRALDLGGPSAPFVRFAATMASFGVGTAIFATAIATIGGAAFVMHELGQNARDASNWLDKAAESAEKFNQRTPLGAASASLFGGSGKPGGFEGVGLGNFARLFFGQETSDVGLQEMIANTRQRLDAAQRPSMLQTAERMLPALVAGGLTGLSFAIAGAGAPVSNTQTKELQNQLDALVKAFAALNQEIERQRQLAIDKADRERYETAGLSDQFMFAIPGVRQLKGAAALTPDDLWAIGMAAMRAGDVENGKYFLEQSGKLSETMAPISALAFEASPAALALRPDLGYRGIGGLTNRLPTRDALGRPTDIFGRPQTDFMGRGGDFPSFGQYQGLTSWREPGANEDLSKRIGLLLDSLKSPIERLREELTLLNDAYAAHLVTQQQYDDGRKRINDEMAAAEKSEYGAKIAAGFGMADSIARTARGQGGGPGRIISSGGALATAFGQPEVGAALVGLGGLVDIFSGGGAKVTISDFEQTAIDKLNQTRGVPLYGGFSVVGGDSRTMAYNINRDAARGVIPRGT